MSLTDPANYTRYREYAEDLQPSPIVIAAAGRLDIRDWIDHFEFLTQFAPIRGVSRKIRTVLLVFHNRKAEARVGVGYELIAEMDHKSPKFSIIPPEQAEGAA